MRALQLLALAGTTPNAPTSPPPPPPPPPGAPSAPTNNALATNSDTQLDQTWTDNASDETGYTAHIATDASFTQNVQTDSTLAAGSTSKTWTGLTEGTQYYARVRADKTGSSSSDWSATDNAYTKLGTPGLLQGTDQGDFIRFTWTDNSSKESEYVLDRDGSDFQTLAANTEQTDVDEADATGSTFKVQARASGIPNSDFSNTSSEPWPS